jgi:hypothetical protein
MKKSLLLALWIFAYLFSGGEITLPSVAQDVKEETSGAETRRTFALEAGKSSLAFSRPEGAAFFWWNAPEEVRVKLKFSDGSSGEAAASENFEKEIVEVVFVNPTKDKVTIELLSMK